MKPGKAKRGKARKAAARPRVEARPRKAAARKAAAHKVTARRAATAARQPVVAVALVADMAPVPANPVAAETAPAVAAVPTPVAAPATTANGGSPRGSGRAGLKLEASCTLRDSIDMQFQLLAVDFGDSDVLVDGSAVERIDTAGLQMLLAFARYHEGRGKAVRWSDVSAELLRSSEMLGVAGVLGLKNAAGDNGGH